MEGMQRRGGHPHNRTESTRPSSHRTPRYPRRGITSLPALAPNRELDIVALRLARDLQLVRELGFPAQGIAITLALGISISAIFLEAYAADLHFLVVFHDCFFDLVIPRAHGAGAVEACPLLVFL